MKEAETLLPNSIPEAVVPEAIVPPAPSEEQGIQERQVQQISDRTIDFNKPIFTLSRNIRVRVMQHFDAEDFARYGDNKKIAQNMRARWPKPYTVDKAHDFIAHIRNQDQWVSVDQGRPANVLNDGGTKDHQNHSTEKQEAQKIPKGWTITMGEDEQIIGSIGFDPEGDVGQRTMSFGYWIGEPFWGQGFATEVVTAFVRWLWDTFPYLVRLSASVYSWNPASARVLEKAGLSFEARLKASVWHYDQVTDLLIYSAIRNGVRTTNVPPTSKE